MNNLHEKLKNIKNELALSSTEREEMRAYLTALPTTPRTTPATAVPSPFFILFTQQRTAYAFVAILLVVFGTGSVSAAAKDALPGEPLYGVKTSLNERFERATAVTSSAKAGVEIRHAEERLREIELLAASGKDDEVASAVFEAEMHINDARARVDALAAGDASIMDADADFESALIAHADILEAQALAYADNRGKIMSDLAHAVRGEDRELASSIERAQKAVEKANERIARKDVSEETRAILTEELLIVAEELKDAERAGSTYGFLQAERHAYRVLTLAESAERIQDKTGKQIYIGFTYDSTEEEVTATARAKDVAPEEDASATLMMMSAPAEEESEDEEEDDDRYERRLEFKVFDDEDEEDDRSGKDGSDDNKDEDNSGSGSSGSGN